MPSSMSWEFLMCQVETHRKEAGIPFCEHGKAERVLAPQDLTRSGRVV